VSEVYDKAATQKLVADLKASGGPFCSFCGMDEAHAGKLVEGPAAYICRGCAELTLETTQPE
jgi:hypothetical protein